MSQRVAVISLLAVLALAVGLRMYGISERSLWLDESFCWAMTQQFSWGEMIERIGRDTHPPLYFVLLRAWTNVFGTSVVAMRGLSVLFAALTCVGMYLFCRDAFQDESPADSSDGKPGRGIGVLAAAFLAVSSSHIQWSTETRMYSLGTMLAIVSTWLLLRAFQAQGNGKRWWTLYAIAATALLYTHNYGLFTVFGQACFTALVLGARRLQPFEVGADLGQPFHIQAYRAVAAIAVVDLAYLPWLPVLLEQTSRVKADYWIPPLSAWSIPNAWALTLVPRDHALMDNSHADTTLAVAVSLFVLLMFLIRSRSWADWLAVTMLLAPIAAAGILSATTVSVIASRHFLFPLVFFLCILANVCWRMGPPPLRVFLAGLVLADGLFIHYEYRRELDVASKPGTRGAVNYVCDQWEEGDGLVVLNPGVLNSVKYYAAGRTGPPKLVVGDRSIKHYFGSAVLRAQEQIPAEQTGRLKYRRLWVIDSTAFGGKQPGLIRSSWLADTSHSFPDAYHFLGEITATLYRRDDAQRSSN